VKIPSPVKVVKDLYIAFDLAVLLFLLVMVRLYKWTFRIGRRYK